MDNKTIVSRISLGIRASNKDARVSKRYILEVATSKAIALMAQKFRDMSLFRESNIFRRLECFEMERVDKYSCDIVEFRTCDNIMKSVLPLPKLVHFKYGSSLKEVTNIDYSIEFKPTTIKKLRNDKKRQEYRSGNFCYEVDNHLFIPDSKVKMVSLYLYTPNLYEMEKLSACKKDECLNPWGFEFLCSDKLLEVVIQETIKELAFRLQIREDENPNMDSNQISKTIV